MKKFYHLGMLVSVTAILLSSCDKENYNLIQSLPTDAKTRIYYIAAEEVVWDYSPLGMNMFMGRPFNDVDSVWAVNLPDGPTPRIGNKNIKARYIEYTDANFTTKKPISPEWQHLGILGPVIRANVGDSVIAYFKNNTTINASIHVHGLVYDANSEGAMYNNGATGGANVEPGGQYIYKYAVREESGPTAAEQSSIAWLYHSHVNHDESDIYAGLIGAIIVTKKGMSDEDAKPIDVDREFVTLFMVIDENASALLQSCVDAYCPGFTNPDPEDFEESNKKHSINGMIMGNLPGLEMNRDDRVRWYVITLGNEVDLHTPHWHGNTVVANNHRTDVIELLPASMVTADMDAYNPGTWAFHCHVSDHLVAGMASLYKVN